MKKPHGLKQKINSYVMSTAIFIALLILIVMSIGNVISTNAVQLDNMQITARIASQSISSNLHLLTERMYNLSTESVLLDDSYPDNLKQACLDEAKQQIEFLWLSAYDTAGNKIYGDAIAPASISDTVYYSDLNKSGNIVISDPYLDNDVLQLCVAVPLKTGDSITSYLVGSYKYDLLQDTLNMLIFGNTGCACIINRDGTIVGDRRVENINRVNLYDEFPSSRNKKVFDKVLAHQTGSGLLRLGHVKNYVGYAPIPGTNWSLFINAPMAEFLRTSIISILIAVGLAIVALASSAATVIKLSNKIAASLSYVTEHLQALANGNLSEEIVLSHNDDETDILTAALAKTTSSLNNYIFAIQSCLGALSDGDYTVDIPENFDGDFISIRNSLCNISASLNQTMLQMHQSSLEINKNSSEVSDYAKQLHDGSLHQSDLLEELENSMSAITASIENNKENVQQIELFSVNAKEKTKQGDTYMQSMLDAMNEIHSAVDEISKISHLIENISGQTNLLSLNASIEAARAGEAGRGFAIVASEIGTLSTQTADALQQTAAIIERSTGIIQNALSTADQTANAFHEIEEVTEQYHTITAKLSHNAAEQTHAVESVNSQLFSVKDIANSNRILAEETDKMAAGSLSQSESLKDYVAQVKIKEM